MLLKRLHQTALKFQLRNESSIRCFLEAPLIEGKDNPSQSLQLVDDFGSSPSTRIVCMSDTHGKHDDIQFLPRGDILIHAGDFTKIGETNIVRSLSRYFQDQKAQTGFKEIVCIAGNHDITLHEDYYKKSWTRHIRSFDPSETRNALKHCTYLEDSSSVLSVGGQAISVYGSPWTPDFFNWAFGLKRGEALKEKWANIPASTDLLVTHGPPHSKGDNTLHSGHFGCYHLLQQVQSVRPRLHVFGHIHEGHGVSRDEHTLYVNASSLDIGYEAVNPCIVVDLPHDKSLPATVVKPIQWINTVQDFVYWLRHNEYHNIAPRMEAAIPHGFVIPNDHSLFSAHTFQSFCDKLGITSRRKKPIRKELQRALNQLYAESFF